MISKRYLRKIQEHLPKVPAMGQSEPYSWIFDGLFNDYIDKLLGVLTVPDDRLTQHRLELREHMRIMEDLTLKMKKTGRDYDGADLDEDQEE